MWQRHASASEEAPPRLSSRQLNALLHGSFRQPQIGPHTGGSRRLQQTPDPAAAGGPEPAYGGIFVVTTTGVSLQTNASEGASTAVASVANVVSTLKAKFTLAKDSSLQPLWNALFWSACALAGVLVLHIALRAAVVWRRYRMPGWLEFPNPELVLTIGVLPIIAAAAASFINADDPGQQAAGVIFAVVLPAVYLALSVWLVFRFLLNSDPAHRAAVYVVSGTGQEEEEEEEEEEVHTPGDGDAAGPGDAQPGVARVSAGSAGTAASDRCGEQSSRRSLLQRAGTSGGEDGVTGWRRRLRRARRWLRRFVSRTLLGYRPHEMDGEWVSTTPGSAFADRYGAVFDCKGPPVRLVPGSYTGRDGGGGLDRGTLVPTEDPTRAGRARQSLQLLGSTMISLRTLLFADILAGMSKGVNPLVPIILLLVVTVLYCLFLRFVSPVHNKMDLIVEAVMLLTGLGNIVCGIVIAVTPPADFQTTSACGWAMLAFQLAGMVAGILPQLAIALYQVFVLASQLIFKLMKKKTPAEKFAEVVQAVMWQDPGILAMKFGDRWLVKTHRRGLQGRRVLHHEHSGHAVVPLPPVARRHLSRLPTMLGLPAVGRQLSRLPTMLQRRDIAGGEPALQWSSAAAAATA